MKPPRKTSSVANVDTAREAYVTLHAARQRLSNEKAKQGDFKRALSARQRERVAIAERLTTGRAAAMVEHGPAAKFDEEVDLVTLASIDREIAALPQAEQLQQHRVNEAAKQVDGAQSALATTVLPFVRAAQDEALVEIRKHVAALCKPLAELLAHETIATTLLGHAMKIPRGAPVPLGGGKLLQSLLLAVPAPFRPDALSTATIGAAAAERRQELLIAITTEK